MMPPDDADAQPFAAPAGEEAGAETTVRKRRRWGRLSREAPRRPPIPGPRPVAAKPQGATTTFSRARR
jgi:hypothetical protein